MVSYQAAKIWRSLLACKYVIGNMTDSIPSIVNYIYLKTIAKSSHFSSHTKDIYYCHESQPDPGLNEALLLSRLMTVGYII